MSNKQIIILVLLFAVACFIFSTLGATAYFLAMQPQTEVTVDTPQLSRKMYFCGIARCRESGDYGEMILENGMNVWRNPDPNRGGIHHRASHGDEVVVIKEMRVHEGPGGLWFELDGGGWANDLRLTDQICTPENLPQYSFTDCLGGEY